MSLSSPPIETAANETQTEFKEAKTLVQEDPVVPIEVKIVIEAGEEEAEPEPVQDSGLTEEEKLAFEEKVTKLKKKLKQEKIKIGTLEENLTFTQNELEQMRQSQNQDQGESQEMPDTMMSKNGEFMTDIGNESRYRDLEQRINEIEAEKMSLESQLN